MYLFYFTLAIIIFNVETNGYLVIITNLKDLRRFANNVSPGDVINNMAANIAPNDHNNNEYYYEDDVNEPEEIIEPQTVETENAAFRSKTKLTDEQLDELVKKVKEKLIQELNLQYAAPDNVYKFASNEKLRDNQKAKSTEEAIKPDNGYERQPMDNKQVKDTPYETSLPNRENYAQNLRPSKTKIQNVRELKMNTMADPNYQYFNEPSNSTPEKKRIEINRDQPIAYNNKARIGRPAQLKGNKKLPLSTPTDENRIFEKMELKYKNDSYEDYVIPEKEDPYSVEKNTFNDKTTPSIGYKTKSIQRLHRKPKLNQLRQVAADDREIMKNTEPVTENNKQNLQSINSEKPKNIKHSINLPQPIRSTKDDIFESEEKVIDYETALVEKARTESMIYDEHQYKNNYYSKDAKSGNNENIKSNKTNEVTTRYAVHGTNIPTREKYRITTPNYYAKLPRVAEKYNFQEPIPEKDREHEILRQIGPKPELINGNVKVR